MSGRPADVATPVEMAVLEQNAVALGVTLGALMENAGRAIADEASRHLPTAPARVAVVAGVGNNGGDGTCAAFYLGQWGYSPEIWLVRPPSEIRSISARRCFERAEHRFPTRTKVPTASELAEFPLVLDALLGSGQAGPIRGAYRESVLAVNASGAPVLSVDVPSGLGGDVAIRPRWTVALTTLKPGMSAENCGEIVLKDIGIPEEAKRRTGPGEFLFYPAPPQRGARGRSGRVFIIGGGPYAGAPALAGLAALRAGAERATVIVPHPASDRVQSFSPDLVVRSVGEGAFRVEDVPKLLDSLSGGGVHSVVMGMGAGDDSSTVDAFRGLLGQVSPQVPVVVDAEALPALDPGSDGTTVRSADRVVATPNQGEYARVFGGTTEGTWDARLESARRIAGRWHLTLLAKGEADAITDGERAYLNFQHSPAVTVSGVGDVLAGVVGALLAQKVPALSAARLAAYWVGEAGNRVAERRGYGLVASDVIEELPFALVAGLRRVNSLR